jgi:hypothetical protein
MRWFRFLVLALVVGGCSVEAAPIQRSRAEVRAFRLSNPCPATGSTKGPCVGWEVDHARALCAGGLDHRSNMQWIAVADHRWKTFVDARECRKLRANAARPAQ